MDAGLRASYEACRRMQRRHDPTYYWATRRLPADVRPAVHALYGYVRTADELVDGPRRPAAPGDRRAALDRWEAALREGRAAGGSPQPVIAALVDAERRHGLPLDELDVYMASMRLDCDPVRIDRSCPSPFSLTSALPMLEANSSVVSSDPTMPTSGVAIGSPRSWSSTDWK